MPPVLVVPAAGRGSRLDSPLPKFLVPVAGRPMIDWLIDLHRGFVSRIVVVVAPWALDLARQHFSSPSVPVDLDVQEQPTGMLDALFVAHPHVERTDASRVWITWCDQIGVHPDTVATLGRLSRAESSTAAILPTSTQSSPYIHLERDPNGRIMAIRQRREGDEMPPVGESDMGLFSLSPEAYFDWLPEFGLEAAQASATRERNFLPFIPWLVRRGHPVVTFPSANELEAIGINTPDDRRRLEAYLRTLEQQ